MRMKKNIAHPHQITKSELLSNISIKIKRKREVCLVCVWRVACGVWCVKCVVKDDRGRERKTKPFFL
jgi:hypothetical protein